MSNISKGFYFRLTNISGLGENFRTKQNVKKNIADIRYINPPLDESVKLAYVGSKELISDTNLFIGDRSDEIYENSKNNTLQEIIKETGSSSISLASENFLATQQFVSTKAGDIPLYYKHILSSNIIPESIKIYDKDFNLISYDSYKIVTVYVYNEDTGSPTSEIDAYYVFNSFKSEYSFVTGDYTVYYIQYTEVISGQEIINTVLLDNEKAYILADYDDFWYVTLGLKPWVYKYNISDLTLTLPTSGKYAVKYEEIKKIKVNHPVNPVSTDPWFVRITNGYFNYGYNGYASQYSIPEFSNQAFNPIEPYKLAARVPCVKMSDQLLKLGHENIQFGVIYSSLNIIFEQDSVIVKAITNNSSLDRTNVYDLTGNLIVQSDGSYLTYSYSDLLSVDTLTGIVNVDFEILDSYDIYATYSYLETYYTLTSLINNPIFDVNINKEIRIIYLVPQNSANENVSTQTASIMWLKVNKSGVILQTNQDGSNNNENLSKDVAIGTTDGYWIEGILGLQYSNNISTTISSSSTYEEITPGNIINVVSTNGFPKTGWLRAKDSSNKIRYFKYTDRTSTTFKLATSITEIPTNGIININNGETVECVCFTQERSTSSTRSAQDELTYWGPEENPLGGYSRLPSVYSQYFILGELCTVLPHSKFDSTIIDVRENGGGIKEELYEDAKAINPEVQWMDNKSFNGQIYPGNVVNVIKLPISILDTFSLDNLNKIVQEAMPFGVWPIIRFYGYSARIISIIPNAGSITINWEKEGIEFTYDIWYSKNQNGPYIKANTVRLIDGSDSYNTFTIDNLSGNINYYVKITMQDKYYQWWYGYNGPNSIEGGYGLEENSPTDPFGNVLNLYFNVI